MRKLVLGIILLICMPIIGAAIVLVSLLAIIQKLSSINQSYRAEKVEDEIYGI